MKDSASRYRRPEGITGKPVTHRKLTGEEFRDLARRADLSDEDIAFMFGTRPERVAAWADGSNEAPFFVCWGLALLETPQNFDHAISIIAPRAKFRPEFTGRTRIQKHLAAVSAAVDAVRSEAVRMAETWERDNAGEHPNRATLRRYDTIQGTAGLMNIARRLEALKEIAGQLGMGIDVNAEIEKANAPFMEKLAAERRARLAKQRAAAPELPAYRQGKK